jgi:hypothetical protein
MADSLALRKTRAAGVKGDSGASPTIVHTSSGPVDTAGIVGWGLDANPQNDPTYSYRDRSADDHSGQWARPTQQESDVEVLISIEHKQLPAAFGTSSPPRWASGAVRRWAFRWTESNWMHWLLLIAADRINMVEGLLQDVARLRVPNIPKEIGFPAAWRHNKKGVAKTGLVVAILIGGLILLMKWL